MGKLGYTLYIHKFRRINFSVQGGPSSAQIEEEEIITFK